MVRDLPANPDRTVDVVVVGSGTGLVAALAAQKQGAETLVVEKGERIGGATAVSNAGIWIPNATQIVEQNGPADIETLKAYINRVSGGRASEELIEAFLERSPNAAEFVERESPLEFESRPLPDYHPEWPGGSADGHTIAPKMYDGNRLGDRLDDVRHNPHTPFPASSQDLAEVGGFEYLPIEISEAEQQRRRDANLLSGGRALIGGLYEACLDAGVEFRLGTPATELLRRGQNGPIEGIVLDDGSREITIVSEAVILAAGGIDWDQDLCDNFLRGPMTAPAGPPEVEGDAIRMGMDVGADLGNMNEAWWYPTAHIGQEWPDGSPVYRMVWNERALPGAIMVNSHGNRFANESGNYHDLGKALHHFDPRTYEYRNLPCYNLFDDGFRSKYGLFLSLTPEDPDPEWLTVADTIESLATAIGVPPESLVQTVDRFNRHAREGEDPDFGRGESAHDRHLGDPDAAHPNLAPLDEPPFYAFEVESGSLGTKGGLVTSPAAAVLDTRANPIPGLYASSNSTAHVMGIGYAGPGATLGPNITFAYIAGQEAAATS